MGIYLSKVLKKMGACEAAVRWVKKRKGHGTLKDTLDEAIKKRPNDVRWLVLRLPSQLYGEDYRKASRLVEELYKAETRLYRELDNQHSQRWRYTDAQWKEYDRDHKNALSKALSKVVTYEKLLPLLDKTISRSM